MVFNCQTSPPATAIACPVMALATSPHSHSTVSATSDGVKTIVISGAGGNFSSGGDVFEIIGPLVQMDTKGLTAFTRMTGDLVKAMRACPQPVVAAVDGICAGAGAIIAMASDMRLAATGAKVAFLFNKVGLAGCDMGACAILPRIIGDRKSTRLNSSHH